MAQVVRHICSRCQTSVYNCIIEGQRVPLVFYMTVGQPEDTGPALDMSAVSLPSPLRALMALPIPRVEYCVRCVAEVMGWPLLAAADDPAMAAFKNVPLLSRQHADAERTVREAIVTEFVHTAVENSRQLQLAKALEAAGVVDPAELTRGQQAATVTVSESTLPTASPVGAAETP